MRTVKLSDLFNIYNGYASCNVELIEQSNNAIKYIRPSKTFDGTIAGYINKDSVPSKYIFPKETIYVSTDGEGSHSYTYVSCFEFVPNSNVSVLIPKKRMTLLEKQFYAVCITKNRFKFSYGRKPKGDRLANIMIPADVPDWVYEVEEPDLSEYKESFNSNKTPELNINEWKEFKLSDLFEINYGKFISGTKEKTKGVPYITTTSENNGIGGYTEETMYKGNCLTIASDGSVGSCFYQEGPFATSNIVSTLQPKSQKFNKYIAMFFIPIIELEKFRYGYGRKFSVERIRTTIIKLPVTDSNEPDYKFMEEYIKTLSFSIIEQAKKY